MGMGLILGCLLQLVYSVLFTPVLALGQTAVLQLGLFFGCVVLFVILIAVITLVWIIYFMGRGAYETI